MVEVGPVVEAGNAEFARLVDRSGGRSRIRDARVDGATLDAKYR